MLHVVSAFDTENEISLGQIATKNDEGKDVGEYNTIPLLLEQLDVEDALVTIDAAGCYTDIVDAVVENKANYLITLKDNQPKLIEEAKEQKRCFRKQNRMSLQALILIENQIVDMVALRSECTMRCPFPLATICRFAFFLWLSMLLYHPD